MDDLIKWDNIEQPIDPGCFVGDIWYGHPEYRTLGTHRWDGKVWLVLPYVSDTLCLLLAKARNRIEQLEARLEITHCTTVDPETGETIRRELTDDERETFPDAVACRDATIALLDARIEQLEARQILLNAECDGLGSMLLSVQTDCIAERKRAEAAEAKLAAAYDAGFAASAEGWNGEYPGGHLEDSHYIECRNNDLRAMMEKLK